MSNPLLSIIIPAFKVEKYIAECIESVISQGIDDIEILVIDDGSPDASGTIAESYASIDSRVVVYHKSNGGLGSARNYGIDRANGRYIAFLDGDDKWMPGQMRQVLDKAIYENADVALYDYVKENSDGLTTVIKTSDREASFEGRELLLKLAESILHPVPEILQSSRIPVSVWSALFRREKVTHRFYSERDVCSEDIPFKIESILKSERVIYVPASVNFYRSNPCSLTNTFSADKFHRYVKLTAILKTVFEATESPDAGDYCMIYALSALTHHAYKVSIKSSLRKKFIKEMADGFNWERLNINVDSLTLKEKLMYSLMKRKHSTVAWLIAELFYGLKR